MVIQKKLKVHDKKFTYDYRRRLSYTAFGMLVYFEASYFPGVKNSNWFK
jgi:hypothetical protein